MLLKRSVWLLVPLGFLLLAIFPVSGCGNGCPDHPMGPGTQVDGPVSIVTDHSLYAPDQNVHVTLVNHLSSTIQTPRGVEGCYIQVIQRQVHGGWDDLGACALPHGDEGPTLASSQIGPGQTVNDNVYLSLGALAGTYRLQFQYITLPVPPSTPSTFRLQYTLVYSATFRICA